MNNVPAARKWLAATVAAALAAGWSQPAAATYSILALNSAEERLGIAVTSCVGDYDLAEIFTPIGTEGAVVAQALTVAADRQHPGAAKALELMPSKLALSGVLAAMTAEANDSDAALRQYSLLRWSGEAIGFTGAQTGDISGHIAGRVGTSSYVIAGNLLTSERVLSQAQTAFRTSPGRLDQKLLASLAAGGQQQQGDRRCAPNGIPGDSAFLGVLSRSGEWLFRASLTDTAPESAISRLQAEWQVWNSEQAIEPTETTVMPEESEPNHCAFTPAPHTQQRSPASVMLLCLFGLSACYRRYCIIFGSRSANAGISTSNFSPSSPTMP